MARVTGIGGVFFKARDPGRLKGSERSWERGFRICAAKPMAEPMLRLLLNLIRPLPRRRLSILHGPGR